MLYQRILRVWLDWFDVLVTSNVPWLRRLQATLVDASWTIVNPGFSSLGTSQMAAPGIDNLTHTLWGWEALTCLHLSAV